MVNDTEELRDLRISLDGLRIWWPELLIVPLGILGEVGSSFGRMVPIPSYL